MFSEVTNHIFFKVFFTLTLLSNISFAGGIDGVILNTENSPIASSQINIIETNQTIKSDKNGLFAFRNLEKGIYNLVVYNRIL